MTDVPRGVDWWQASDGRWYPPELRSGTSKEPPGQPAGSDEAEAHPPEPAVPSSEPAVPSKEKARYGETLSFGPAPKRPASAQRRDALIQPDDDATGDDETGDDAIGDDAIGDDATGDAASVASTRPTGVASDRPGDDGRGDSQGSEISGAGTGQAPASPSILLELRGSRLTSDIDRIGDRLEITETDVVQRGRGNRLRGQLAMSDVAAVEVEKTHKGFWLRVKGTDGSEILQQGLEGEPAEAGCALIRERSPMAARYAEEAAERAAAVIAEITAAKQERTESMDSTVTVVPAPTARAATVDIPEQIRKLAELRDQGILDEDEFQTKKKELLDRL